MMTKYILLAGVVLLSLAIWLNLDAYFKTKNPYNLRVLAVSIIFFIIGMIFLLKELSKEEEAIQLLSDIPEEELDDL